MVYSTEDNWDFYALRDDEQPVGTIELTVGGQAGDYELKRLVPLSRAIEAAHIYFDLGIRESTLNWALDD